MKEAILENLTEKGVNLLIQTVEIIEEPIARTELVESGSDDEGNPTYTEQHVTEMIEHRNVTDRWRIVLTNNVSGRTQITDLLDPYREQLESVWNAWGDEPTIPTPPPPPEHDPETDLVIWDEDTWEWTVEPKSESIPTSEQLINALLGIA